jgi:hypothetical protein
MKRTLSVIAGLSVLVSPFVLATIFSGCKDKPKSACNIIHKPKEGCAEPGWVTEKGFFLEKDGTTQDACSAPPEAVRKLVIPDEPPLKVCIDELRPGESVTITSHSIPVDLFIEDVVADRPRFERIYKAWLDPEGRLVKVTAKTLFNERWFDGELDQADGKYIIFKVEAVADKILDPTLVPLVQAKVDEILRMDAAFIGSNPKDFTDEDGIKWTRDNRAQVADDKFWEGERKGTQDLIGVLRTCKSFYVQGDRESLNALKKRYRDNSPRPCIIFRQSAQSTAPKESGFGFISQDGVALIGGTFDGYLPVEP